MLAVAEGDLAFGARRGTGGVRERYLATISQHKEPSENDLHSALAD